MKIKASSNCVSRNSLLRSISELHAKCWSLIFLVVGGCGGEYRIERSGRTYTELMSEQLAIGFDPVGGSNFSYCIVSDIDSSDRWFQFTVDEDGYCDIISAVKQQSASIREFEWSNARTPPAEWRSRHSEPTWWGSPDLVPKKSISWCVGPREVGDTLTLGWFFAYDPDSQTACFWNWQYQWADCKCP